jgi:riboflavin kinase/FMN adenylyltransferase
VAEQLSGAAVRQGKNVSALYEGVVLHGAKLGRTIGFPTANIAVDVAPPAVGIYAARAKIGLEAWRDAVAYYGRRPTVDGKQELLEVFIFDFDQEIYGAVLTVELVSFLRGDVTFPDLEAMRLQIAEDCSAARRALAPHAVLFSRLAHSPD